MQTFSDSLLHIAADIIHTDCESDFNSIFAAGSAMAMIFETDREETINELRDTIESMLEEV